MPFDSILCPAKKQNPAIHLVELWYHSRFNQCELGAVGYLVDGQLRGFDHAQSWHEKGRENPDLFLIYHGLAMPALLMRLGRRRRGSLLCLSGILQSSGFRKISGEGWRADLYAFFSQLGGNL